MILLDFDGTLVDSNQVWVDIDHQFLREHGLVATEEYLALVGKSIFPVAAQITKDYYHMDVETEEIMNRWRELAYHAYAHRIPMKAGACDFLQGCRERGEVMALVTACEPLLCQVALDRLELHQFFTHIVYVQQLGVEKGHPTAFPRILEQLGVAGQECTLYEDSPTACKAALNCGIKTVAVYDPCYAHAKEELTALCHSYVHSFEDVL